MNQLQAAKHMAEAINKVVFSQLGGIVHSMIEFGSTQHEVNLFVKDICGKYSLRKSHEASIIAHAEKLYKSKAGNSDSFLLFP